MFAA
jgi:hypothetical protein